jgi:uncharacterized protein YlxP (DUF503 family)
MSLWIGVAALSAEITEAGSLKDRRSVVKSLTERLRKHYSASCVDLGPDGSWGRADIAAVCAGSSRQETEARVAKMCSFLERAEGEGEFAILSIEREVFAYGDF